jgi:predicted unusual protein kinase regulating ubiquinone biosynthesis (AarF/ABC1/UbiB family)
VTSKFNELVYQYPIRIPERYSLVIRSLLTQEGICLTLKPQFHFLEVAYPYVARWATPFTPPLFAPFSPLFIAFSSRSRHFRPFPPKTAPTPLAGAR